MPKPTVTRPFFRYRLLGLGWTPFLLSQYRLIVVLETLLRDYWSIMTQWHHTDAADFFAAHPYCEPPVPPHLKGAPLG